MADSTNAERRGFTMSERTVGATFDDIFSRTKGRLIVATFSSNIHRVQQIIDTRRKVQSEMRNLRQKHGKRHRCGASDRIHEAYGKHIDRHGRNRQISAGTACRYYDGQSGRADVGTDAHGSSDTPANRHCTGRHRHHFREPDSRQRKADQQDDRRAVQARRKCHLQINCRGSRFRTCLRGRAQINAGNCKAEIFYAGTR